MTIWDLKASRYDNNLKPEDKFQPANTRVWRILLRLVECLRDFGPGDWQLACLVCKTLWNFSENITNASECFGDDVTNTLLILLSTFLGKSPCLKAQDSVIIKKIRLKPALNEVMVSNESIC